MLHSSLPQTPNSFCSKSENHQNDQDPEKSNDMNKKEAQSLLSKILTGYRKYSFAELQSRLGKIDARQVNAESGAQYQVEVQLMWDDDRQQNIRVMGAIDDGGWRAFLPLTDSFIMAPDGSFVGE